MDVRVQQTLVQYSSVGEFVFWQMGTYLENYGNSMKHILVGGFKHFLLPINFHNIWDNPSHGRTHIFQDGEIHQPAMHIVQEFHHETWRFNRLTDFLGAVSVFPMDESTG